MLAYIDDIVIKHLMEEGTDGIIRTLYRLTWYLRDKNMTKYLDILLQDK